MCGLRSAWHRTRLYLTTTPGCSPERPEPLEKKRKTSSAAEKESTKGLTARRIQPVIRIKCFEFTQRAAACKLAAANLIYCTFSLGAEGITEGALFLACATDGEVFIGLFRKPWNGLEKRRPQLQDIKKNKIVKNTLI